MEINIETVDAVDPLDTDVDDPDDPETAPAPPRRRGRPSLHKPGTRQARKVAVPIPQNGEKSWWETIEPTSSMTTAAKQQQDRMAVSKEGRTAHGRMPWGTTGTVR